MGGSSGSSMVLLLLSACSRAGTDAGVPDARPVQAPEPASTPRLPPAQPYYQGAVPAPLEGGRPLAAPPALPTLGGTCQEYQQEQKEAKEGGDPGEKAEGQHLIPPGISRFFLDSLLPSRGRRQS